MQTVRNKRKPLTRMFIVFCLLFSAACGGGGGSASNEGQASLAYNGSTDRILINASNATEVTAGAVDNGIRGNVFSGFASLESSSQENDTHNFSPFYLAEMMEETVSAASENVLSPKGSIMTVRTSQQTVEGSCGGQGTGTFSVDDATGEIWGELTFLDYCESTVTLNGTTSFTGLIDPSTSQFESMSFDFSKLKGSDASSSFLIDGTMYLVREEFETGITMNLFIEDSQSRDVFWLNDYHLLVVDDVSTVTINISGKYYHPDYGYVTLSTQENLAFAVDRMVPVSGVLLAIGKNGSSGGATTAILTCRSGGAFRVEADTDGDEVYDWDSGTLFWDDL